MSEQGNGFALQTEWEIARRLENDMQAAEAARNHWINMAKDYRNKADYWMAQAKNAHAAYAQAMQEVAALMRERDEQAATAGRMTGGLAISHAKHEELVQSMREVLKPEGEESLREAAERVVRNATRVNELERRIDYMVAIGEARKAPVRLETSEPFEARMGVMEP